MHGYCVKNIYYTDGPHPDGPFPKANSVALIYCKNRILLVYILTSIVLQLCCYHTTNIPLSIVVYTCMVKYDFA